MATHSVHSVATCICGIMQAVHSHSCHRVSWTMPTINPPRPLPPGIYTGVVEDVAFGPLLWRVSDRNPDGLTVRFAVRIEADDGPAHVFDTIDFDHHDRLAAVFASCDKPLPLTPEKAAQELSGCHCRIFTKNITPQRGKGAGVAKAVISSWLPSAPTKPWAAGASRATLTIKTFPSG
jgi:hypothetical protein